MSFPKAKLKRFNEISVFSSPFTKDTKEPKCGGSAKKDKEKDKITDKDLKDCKSVTSGTTCDMESVKSSKYRLFRTPSLPKRLKFRSTSDSTSKPKEEPFPFPLPAALRQKEALEAAQIEIKNKTETITECHSVIEELKNENHRLESLNTELRSQKRKMKDDLAEMEKDIGCLRRGNELLQSIAQGSLDKITELERDRNEMVQDYESAIAEMKRINQLSSIEILSVTNELTFYKREVESFNVSLKECEIKMGMLIDDNNRLQSEMEQVKRQADEDAFSFVKENQAFTQRTTTVEQQLQHCLDELKRKQEHIAALEEEICEKQVDIDSERDELREEYTSRIDELEKIIEQRSNEINQLKQATREGAFNNDRNEMITYYEGELEKLRKEHAKELAHRDQINEEKVRISEIQYEEKMKGLETCLETEKRNWNAELQQCQKIAESEIMQSEFEKRDLKTILDSANELLREKDDKIQRLEAMIKHEEDTYTKVRSEVETEVAELKQLNQQLMTEKHNYQITLNSTRSTVQILMERLKKSDTDVESLKADIDLMTIDKSNMEVELNSLKEQLIKVSEEKEEFKAALNILKVSAEALQREMREKESIFEKMMSSEEETLNTVHNLGKLFNDKVEENLSKYYEMYNELRQKYEARESYIKDMKTLLDEFATGIEFARMELEAKDKRIVDLEEENKTIKLENMTYKFRCESLEKYSGNQEQRFSGGSKVPPPTPDLIEDAGEEDSDTIVTPEVIQTIIQDLERNELKETNDRQRIDLLQEIVQGENEEIKYLKSKLSEMINKLEKTEESAKESYDKYSMLVSQQTTNSEDTSQLKNRLKHQEEMINELKDLMIAHTTTSHSCPSTPRKLNRSGRISITHTPKTPKNVFSGLVTGEGKENISPAVVLSPKVNVLRTRNA